MVKDRSNSCKKKIETPILIPDKVEFYRKNIKLDKKGHFTMIKQYDRNAYRLAQQFHF